MSRRLPLVPAACLVPVLGVIASAQMPPNDARVIELITRERATNAGAESSQLGSGGRVYTWVADQVPHYAISLNGTKLDIVRPTSYDILLRYAQFDPLKGEPDVPAALQATSESGIHLVQFVTQPLPEYRDAIEALGGRVAAYLGEHAYIVRIAPEATAKIASLPFVRWVGAFHPAYRIDEEFLAMAGGDASASGPARRYSILAMPQDMGRVAGDVDGLAASLGKIGVTVHYVAPEESRIEATMTPAQLVAVSKLDDVLFIDRWEAPTTYMDLVRSTGGATYLSQVAGFTGQGVRGEVMDSNLLQTHADFQRLRPVMHGGFSGDSSHGTSVFGIVFGTGTSNASGRGMLPDAQGIFADFGNLTDRGAHIARLSQSPYFAVFQTNSWGSCCFTTYTTQAAAIDDILFRNDFLMLQAQANSGSTSSDAIAFAKNLVSVGGVQHLNSASLTDDRWQNAGSIGPASDGRIKPDLAFWYDNIFTTANTGGYTSTFGGTSAATPMTAGHFGLFFQMWSEGLFGNSVTPGATVFANRPHMSTAKAMMINTAASYPFVGTTADLTRTHQGWGRADVRRLYDTRDRFFIIDESHVLSNLAQVEYQLNVAPGTPELRATLVYSDPAGTPNSTRHRVNDLTLRVTAPNGTVYWGNNGLRAGNVSTAGGVPNVVDTVENVWITSPEAGEWTIQIQANEVVRDAHVETPAVDADFALVVSGVTRICPADFNDDASVDGDDVIAFFAAWDQNSIAADANQDGSVDGDDVIAFFLRWDAGC